MKSRPNPFALLLRLVIIVEMVLGSTIYFPAVALASAPEKVPFAPALQSGNSPPVALDDGDAQSYPTGAYPDPNADAYPDSHAGARHGL